ncbi:MAG: hypothetical protein WC470_02285 [Candidatus Paceibacterota bacterium]
MFEKVALRVEGGEQVFIKNLGAFAEIAYSNVEKAETIFSKQNLLEDIKIPPTETRKSSVRFELIWQIEKFLQMIEAYDKNPEYAHEINELLKSFCSENPESPEFKSDIKDGTRKLRAIYTYLVEYHRIKVHPGEVSKIITLSKEG